ncbi:hypothetical protein Tco_1361751 [Tanacetum coccineum]
MPRILIPLRPILGVLQIGIKSQGYREPDTIMSDSEHSTVTYTTISSPYEDPSDMGSPGVEGPIFQPVYPEFLPVDDEVFPAEEQPLPAADSPTHQSPGYIPESDPEEDLEEDDEEDPEEDPADYPARQGEMTMIMNAERRAHTPVGPLHCCWKHEKYRSLPSCNKS